MRRIATLLTVASVLATIAAPGIANAATKSVSDTASTACAGSRFGLVKFNDSLDYTQTRLTVVSSKTEMTIRDCHSGYLKSAPKLKLKNVWRVEGYQLKECSGGFPSGVSCTGSTSSTTLSTPTLSKSDASRIAADYSNLTFYAKAGGNIEWYIHQTTGTWVLNGNSHTAMASARASV